MQSIFIDRIKISYLGDITTVLFWLCTCHSRWLTKTCFSFIV